MFDPVVSLGKGSSTEKLKLLLKSCRKLLVSIFILLGQNCFKAEGLQGARWGGKVHDTHYFCQDVIFCRWFDNKTSSDVRRFLYIEVIGFLHIILNLRDLFTSFSFPMFKSLPNMCFKDLFYSTFRSKYTCNLVEDYCCDSYQPKVESTPSCQNPNLIQGLGFTRKVL